MEQKAEAFKKYLRTGNDAEFKALSVQVDPDGGYLVTPEMSDEIVKKVFESSPVRQLASVQQIGTSELEIIQDLDEAAAAWVGETSARAATATPQLKKIRIPVHEMYAFPLATQKILDDAFVNVESWISEHVSMKFSRTEATAFISGDGVNKPRGILSYAAGTGFEQIEQVETATQAVLVGDDLINIRYALKGAYLPGAAWLFKRSTIAAIRKLKETSTDNYIWQPGLQGGQPDTLLGYPIYEADDLSAIGAGNLSGIFGNFAQGYQVVDRFGIRVLRDPFTAKPYVGFYTTMRVGGAVKNFEALKILKIKA
jgi:HK97 family phage major capsid protein